MKGSSMKKRWVATCCPLLLVGAVVQFAVAQPTWTSNGPKPRYAHSAVFDPSTRQMIIYGGYSPQNPHYYIDGDVWRLLPSASLSGGQNWVASHPTGTPPAARYGHLGGYDPQSNRMIVFAGKAPGCTNDVWVLSNANGNAGPSAWLQLSPIGSVPSPRGFSAGAYDPTSNTLMVYGGDACGSALGDYSVLSNANGLGGTPTWTEFFPTGGPGARSGATAVYDPGSHELILFGGWDGANTYFNDVWVLTNANGTAGTPVWQQVLPTGGPPFERAYSSATYDPVSDVMTMCGGYHGPYDWWNDVWVLTNASGTHGTHTAWAKIAQSSVIFPLGRYSHTAVYDASRNVMIMFGGNVTNKPLAANDIFFLSDANGQ